jgi:hypothetical protein
MIVIFFHYKQKNLKGYIHNYQTSHAYTVPENDCENIKYDGSGNLEANKSLSLQQQANNNDSGNINSEGEMTEDITTKMEKQKRDNGGFFFGLFK